MGATTSRNVTNTYASANRVAHSAAAHPPNPPSGTPQGTVPHPNHTDYLGDRGASLAINLTGNVTGNEAMAHYTPPNPDAHLSNLSAHLRDLTVEVSHLPH